MAKTSSSALRSVPASRLFVAPRSPFDTEIAVLGAGCVTRDDPRVPGVSWIASPDLPDAPLWAVVRDDRALTASSVDALVDHVVATFRRGIVPAPAERNVVVESAALADRMSSRLAAAGMQHRSDDVFFGIAAGDLAALITTPLELEPMIGDDPWRDWRVVERAILEERIPGASDALLDRIVEFKRRQQRNTPPIRRFLARDDDGAPIAMIGYAPFAACDLGYGPAGVLARLRDVAVVPRARRRGVARALLRAIAALAIAECDATQVLIGAAGVGAPLALYRGIGARPIGGFVSFRGDL